MSHVKIPRHTINTYALSDFQALLLLKAGVYVEASFKLFGKAKTWRLLDFADAWDLGSSYKGWYQPGLSARYDDECIGPDLPWQVTNHFPSSATSDAGLLGATNAAGVPAGRHCGPLQGGGVCRYPEPPVEAAGDVHHLVRWCRDDLPKHAEDPSAPTNDDLVGGIVETTEWGQELGLDLWAENQLCVDGQMWTEWMAGLAPTYDDSGAVVDPGNLAGPTCAYEDPERGGAAYTFPCAELAERMLAYWGCTDAASPLGIHVAKAPGVTTTTYPGIDSPVLDLDSIFVERPLPEPFVEDGGYSFTVQNLRPELRTPMGIVWLRTVSLCFDERFEDPAETACECESDVGCKVELGERCRQGRCEKPRRRNAGGECLRPGCEPVWTPRRCPIVHLEIEAGPCCGDGVVQQTAGYQEECDPGNGTGNGCDERCRSTEPRGACCLIPGLCTEDVAASRCEGSFHLGLRCSEVESCRTAGGPVLGVCCDPVAGCREEVTAADCERGTWSPGLLCSEINGCREDVVGACCEGAGICHEEVRLAECRGGAFHPGRSCHEVESCRSVHPRCAPAPPNMVAWWSFDDGESESVVERRSRANGTLHGGAVRGPGRVGQALDLDGEGHVEVADQSALALGLGDFTIDLWLRTEREEGVRPIVDKRHEDRLVGSGLAPARRRGGTEVGDQPILLGPVRGFELYLDDGRPGLQLADGSHTNYDSGFEIADGHWHHLAVTVDRDDPEGIRWYLDGIPAGRRSDPTGRSGSLTSEAPLLIGVERVLISERFRGRVDELEIFRRALAPPEVAAIHASRGAGKCRCAPPPPGMLGWWSFEGEGLEIGRDRRGGAPGEVQGAVRSVPGVVGSGLRFEGGVLRAPDGGGPNIAAGDLSVDAWVRTRSRSGTILDRRERRGREYRGYSLFVYRGELGLQLADGRWSNYLSGIPIADGAWHHVAVTVDRDAPDGIRWYLDGEEAGTRRNPRGRTGPLSNDGALVLGGRSFEASGRWRGELDEVEVFGRVLGVGEVWRIWTAGPEGKCTCPNPFDPHVAYVSQDPQVCRVIRLTCGPGERPFSNECGCGCRGLEVVVNEGDGPEDGGTQVYQ
ncbi:MAG: LamG domain-containing protein [Gemmatimonadota bacterium]